MTIPDSLIDPPGIERLLRAANEAPEGNFVEVGVYKGGSAWHLNEVCKKRGCELYLFDTFTGMPFQGELDVCGVGLFFETSYERVCAAVPEAHVYKGVFPETMPKEMKDISFAHLDCDQEYSIKSSIDVIVPRMVRDGIIYIDDYEGMPGVKRAVESSFDEFEVVFGGRALWRNNGRD